ncbi:MAG: GtrA family protein [Halioglobus sp.]
MNAEIFRYLIAGGLAFSFDFLAFYLCTEMLGLHYLLANVVGYFAGLSVAYTLNTRWVFSHRKYENAQLEFLLFNTIVVTGLIISEAIMSLLVELLLLNPLYAKLVAAFFVMLFNFTAKKFLLFSSSPDREAN